MGNDINNITLQYNDENMLNNNTLNHYNIINSHHLIKLKYNVKDTTLVMSNNQEYKDTISGMNNNQEYNFHLNQIIQVYDTNCAKYKPAKIISIQKGIGIRIHWIGYSSTLDENITEDKFSKRIGHVPR